ncbi:MAG: hypothetical protein Q9220_002835 [cf. Caloplaca sp. 1 TL-2023]
MSAGFGFSVGDIVAGLKLIKQSIEALQDTKGSSADYQTLKQEIDSLKDALEAVADLQLDERFSSRSKQHLAIQAAISRCWDCIDTFLSTTSKYERWLQVNSASGLSWKANVKKIQWALSKKDDVNRFRSQLERHCSSINMLLVTLQVNRSLEQSNQLDQQYQVSSHSYNESLALRKDLDRTATLLVGLSLEQRRFFQSLLESNRQLVQCNERISHELRDIRGAVQLQSDLPPQVALSKPVTLLDACGRITAFHLDFIDCPEALIAVLRIRFQQYGVNERGLKMLENSNFVLQDHKGQLDLSKPWSQVLRPSQKVDMSMVFHRDLPPSVCPACATKDENSSGESIECFQCGLFYQRVQEGVKWPPDALVAASDSIGDRLLTRGERNEKYHGNSDVIDQFRRVQLVCTDFLFDSDTEAPANPSMTTRRNFSSQWTDNEKKSFRSLIGITGTNWRSMSRKMGTKSPASVRLLNLYTLHLLANFVQLEVYYEHCCRKNIPGIRSKAQAADHLRNRSSQPVPASKYHLFDMSAALLNRLEQASHREQT